MTAFELTRQHFCFHKKFLVSNLVSKNLKVKYRRSILGVFWTLLTPLLSALVYFAVFQIVLKVQRENYLLVMISGVLAWNFFSQTVTEGVSHYVDNQNLITKISLPLQAFNLSTAATNLVTLLAAIPIVILVGIFMHVKPTLNLLALPPLILALFLITYACSIIVAILFVFLRDLRQVISLVLQLLFYATPILYAPDMVPEKYRFILRFNPLTGLIPGIQAAFTGSLLNMATIIEALAWSVALTIVAMLMVKRMRRSVVENL
ncbi:MAG: ABC transporter permease [Proteobacteria bacterium]|nr:MAG: ABC transporter permease [Pseudomonadota bacterium]